MTKRYDVDFKLNTVKLVLKEGKVTSQFACNLKIFQKTVCGWIAQYKKDPKHPFVGLET